MEKRNNELFLKSQMQLETVGFGEMCSFWYNQSCECECKDIMHFG